MKIACYGKGRSSTLSEVVTRGGRINVILVNLKMQALYLLDKLIIN
jgi:hypothetical protein